MIKTIKLMGITLLGMLISACTSIPYPNIAAADFAVQNQNELITLEAGEKTLAFTARIENDGSTIRVVAITPTGQRLFSFEKRGEQLISEAGPLWPQAMPLAAVWADIEMAHARFGAALASDWRQERDANTTRWSYRGQPQASVEHAAERIILNKNNYRLTLETLEE